MSASFRLNTDTAEQAGEALAALLAAAPPGTLTDAQHEAVRALHVKLAGKPKPPRRRRVELTKVGTGHYQTRDRRYFIERRSSGGWQLDHSVRARQEVLHNAGVRGRRFATLAEAAEALAVAIDLDRQDLPADLEPVKLVSAGAIGMRTEDGSVIVYGSAGSWHVAVPGQYNSNGEMFLSRWGLRDTEFPSLAVAQREIAEALWREQQRTRPDMRYPDVWLRRR